MKWSLNNLEKLIQKAEDSRRFIEKDWYINTLFLEGKHYVTYDTGTNSLRRIKKTPGQVQRTINSVARYRDVMTRLITKDEPKIEIRYSGYDTITDELREQVDIVDHLMKEKWRTKQLGALVVSSVSNALAYSYAANELYWDSNARDGEGDIAWKPLDIWELWFDPAGKLNLHDGEFNGNWILRRVKVSKSDLLANPKYNKEVVMDLGERHDFNEVKKNLDSILYETTDVADDPDALILDIWYVKTGEWKKIDKDKYKYEEDYKIYETCQGKLLWETEMDLPEFPIKILKTRITDTIYGRPLVSDQIDLNKTVDQLYSSMEEYARTMVHGRILKHDQTKMSAISAVSGQVVEWSGARPPIEMNMGGINASLFQFLQEAKQNQMEMARLSDGTLGTGNATSGLELGIRKAADIENASEPAQALGFYLSNIIKYFLKLYVKHLNTSMPITYGVGGEEKIKKVISKNAPTKPTNTVLINAFDDIEVKIMPSSAFSDLQIQQDILQLAQIGAVDRETVLETFLKGSTKDVLRRIKRAELEAQGVEGEVADAVQEADEENKQFIAGKKVTDYRIWKSVQAKKAALETNAQLLQSLIEQQGDPKIIKNITKHLQESAKSYGIPVGGGQPQAQIEMQKPMGKREQMMQPIQNVL